MFPTGNTGSDPYLLPTYFVFRLSNILLRVGASAGNYRRFAVLDRRSCPIGRVP